MYMAKKKSGPGRKPVKPAEKVILVGFYTKKYVIDSLGGMERTRELAKKYIEQLPDEINTRNEGFLQQLS